jgi:hypothetical protein
VEAKRHILIVTDEAESTQEMGARIAGELAGNEVVLKNASEFSGDDILPADTFFFGCESPHPRSFAYFEQVLLHINLAGRSCGLFSPHSLAAIRYLVRLVRDSGLILHVEPFLKAKSGDIGAWIQKTIH